MNSKAKIYSEFIKKNKIVVGYDCFFLEKQYISLNKDEQGLWYVDEENKYKNKNEAIYFYVINKQNLIDHTQTTDKEYINLPPKDVMNAIWGSAFDYEDFDKKILNQTVRQRVYDTWQNIHLVLKDWIETDEKNFLDCIKNNTPDIKK